MVGLVEPALELVDLYLPNFLWLFTAVLTTYVISLRHCLLLRVQDVQGEGTMDLNSSEIWDCSASAGVDWTWAWACTRVGLITGLGDKAWRKAGARASLRENGGMRSAKSRELAC